MDLQSAVCASTSSMTEAAHLRRSPLLVRTVAAGLLRVSGDLIHRRHAEPSATIIAAAADCRASSAMRLALPGHSTTMARVELETGDPADGRLGNTRRIGSAHYNLARLASESGRTERDLADVGSPVAGSSRTRSGAGSHSARQRRPRPRGPGGPDGTIRTA
jgi:hypothetical protein